MSAARTYVSKLEGARVLVIGGSSGIGFGIAQALLENGATVIISSSSAERVKKAVDRLETAVPAAEGQVQGLACNLGSRETLASEIANLFVEVVKGGPLDHVVHTAGDALAVKPLDDFDLESIQQAGMVRFFSPLLIAQHVKKALKPGPHSSFTLTCGGVADRPQPNWVVINSYMTGLQGMTRGLALDLAPIRVNIVSPGAVDTELWDGLREDGSFDKMMEIVTEKMATGAIGKAEDVAECYLYIMKDKNITGECINTNGGAFLA